MKTLLALSFVLFTAPAFAQMSTFQDNNGTHGMAFQHGPLSTFSDSTGRQGQVMDHGNGIQTYSDNRGNSGTIFTPNSQWSQIGGSVQGNAFRNGDMGQFNLQQNGQTTQGQWQTFGQGPQ